ncbi:hypothetical protein FUAX_02650 [Fulvitalea axinellae]|uniref:Tetratricopeptide repeat protein n=1 Tax=Fulvitalea axinellae TaxID=1182444 RepID=A0AAU9CIN5_9BACT|nr:hypothetical protein FUAX_02650 [Fulvitalea axinellae]
MGTYGRKLILAFLAIAMATAANAQNWKWPADTAMAKEKYVLMHDNVKAKNYADALEPFTWLHENCPDLNKAIYIDGGKIYKGLVASAPDKAKKSELTETLVKLYQERIERFGSEKTVYPQIANAAYKAWAKDSSKYDFVLESGLKTMELMGPKTYPHIAQSVIYMMYQKKRGGTEYTEEQILDAYDKVSNVFAAQKEAGKNVAKYEQKVNQMLNAMVKINCDLIKDKFVPKMESSEGEAQLKAAQYVFKLSMQAECISEPYFVESMIVLNKHTPSAALAKNIAKRYLKDKKGAEAAPFIEQALSLETEPAKKAELYLIKARSKAASSKSEARRLAFEAAKTDASVNKDAYTLVGNLYMQSYESCKQGKSRVKDRAVFLAAYEMFKKAGNTAKMNVAKQQFPSSEDIFSENLNEGDKIQVGCWINTSATLQRR